MRLTTLTGEACAQLSIKAATTLRSAMQRMNETGRTLLLVVEGRHLTGVVADGDIRRHLALGGTMDQPVEVAVNRTPVTLEASVPVSDVREFMVRRGLESVPLVDSGNVVALSILERAPRATDMSAVVMAGGLGTRLAPLTDNCPKPLLPLDGKPILSHIVEHLRDQGIHRYVFSVNHLSNMIVDHYDDGSRWDCFIDYVHEKQRLGTGGSLSLVDRESLSDPFLCVNGDVLSDIDVGALRDLHVSRSWDATMVVRGYSHTVPYGVVESDESGAYLELREKPVHSFQVNAGIYMLSKSVLDVVPGDEFYDLPSVFTDLRKLGKKSGTYLHGGRWIDIGTVGEYSRARSIFEAEVPRA